MKPPRPAPRKPFALRLSETERAAIEAQARRAGLDASAWCRIVLCLAAGLEPSEARAAREFRAAAEHAARKAAIPT